MERYEREREFLDGRLSEVTEQLESRLRDIKREQGSAEPVHSWTRQQIFRYEAERTLIESMLSEELKVPLSDRLLQRIRKREEDEIEQIGKALSTKGYSEDFWTDQLYIELLRDLLYEWGMWRGEEPHNASVAQR